MSIEWLRDGDETLAVIIPANYQPAKTEFITPINYGQQLGYVIYKAGESIPAHIHISVNRNLSDTTEVIFIKFGKVAIDLYTRDRKLMVTRILTQGDIILFISGGHGMRIIEDAVMVEIKQGPYIGKAEKEKFNL